LDSSGLLFVFVYGTNFINCQILVIGIKVEFET